MRKLSHNVCFGSRSSTSVWLCIYYTVLRFICQWLLLLLFVIAVLRKNLATYPGLVMKSLSSCPSLLSEEIINTSHHTHLHCLLFFKWRSNPKYTIENFQHHSSSESPAPSSATFESLSPPFNWLLLIAYKWIEALLSCECHSRGVQYYSFSIICWKFLIIWKSYHFSISGHLGCLWVYWG